MQEKSGILFEEWRDRTTSKDSLTRCDAAESFPSSGSQFQVSEILIQMLNDENDLVQTSAAESLAFFKSVDVRDALWKRLHIEGSELVRGYLVSSIGEIGDMQDWQRLVDLSKSSSSTLVISNALVGMHRLISRHVTKTLSEIAVTKRGDVAAQVTSLMVFLHNFWLRDVAEFVDDIGPIVDRRHGLWVENLSSLTAASRDEHGPGLD